MGISYVFEDYGIRKLQVAINNVIENILNDIF